MSYIIYRHGTPSTYVHWVAGQVLQTTHVHPGGSTWRSIHCTTFFFRFSDKKDSDKDPGVDIGLTKVKVKWYRDLPKFESEYDCGLPTTPISAGPRILQFVSRAPPRRHVVAKLKECGESPTDKLASSVSLDLEALDDNCIDANAVKKRVRIRRDSGSGAESNSDETMSVDSEASFHHQQPSSPKDSCSSHHSADSRDCNQDIINSSQKLSPSDVNKLRQSQQQQQQQEEKRPVSQLSFGINGRASVSSYQNLQRVKKSTSKVVSTF